MIAKQSDENKLSMLMHKSDCQNKRKIYEEFIQSFEDRYDVNTANRTIPRLPRNTKDQSAQSEMIENFYYELADIVDDEKYGNECIKFRLSDVL